MGYPYSNGDVLSHSDMNAVGLHLVTPTSVTGGTLSGATVTIGSAVSSVAVVDAFSSTFDNYLIMVRINSTSGGPYIQMRMGATSTTDYWGSLVTADYLGNASGSGDNGDTEWGYVGAGHSSGTSSFSVEVRSPHLASRTMVSSNYVDPNPVNGARAGTFNGFLNNTTSYDDFTFLVSTGTMSGGEIRVYGYSNG